MKKIVKYQPIVDAFFRMRQKNPLVFKSPPHCRPKQRTLKDLNNLHMPDKAPLEAEWTDGSGYHRATVTGAWESEAGSVVLTVGKEQVVPERGDGND